MFSFFSSPTLSFSESLYVGAEKRIWKLYPDLYSGLLVVEIRGIHLPEVSFIVIDTEKRTLLQPEFQIDGGWWCAVNAVVAGVMYITWYEGTHNPEPAFVQAYDINRQKVLWQKKEMRFSEAIFQAVALYPKYLSDSPLWFNAQTGKELTQQLIQKKHIHVILPYHYLEIDTYYKVVAEFLRIKYVNDLVEAVDYAETDNTILISYYQKNNNLYINKLHAFDKAGNSLWCETLGENLTGIGDETFFILNQNVIFVQNLQTLCIKKIV